MTHPTLPMTPAQRELFDAAVAMQARSYSPYSGYKVGAAIRTKRGTVFAACNVENAAYPQSTCAEASAIVSDGKRMWNAMFRPNCARASSSGSSMEAPGKSPWGTL